MGLPERVNEDEELRTIWRIAHGLVTGTGVPEELENTGTARGVKGARRAYGRTQLSVCLDDQQYKPLAAMCLAGFCMYGYDFEVAYHALDITGDLIFEYHRLTERFDGCRADLADCPHGEDALGGKPTAMAIEAPKRRGLIAMRPPDPLPANPVARAQLAQLAAGSRRIALPGK